MQQIAEWLEKLGMSEYAQRFAENKIDVSVLRHLTDPDLKDIGVPLGHRRKMLAAISELVGTDKAVPKPIAVAKRANRHHSVILLAPAARPVALRRSRKARRTGGAKSSKPPVRQRPREEVEP